MMRVFAWLKYQAEPIRGYRLYYGSNQFQNFMNRKRKLVHFNARFQKLSCCDLSFFFLPSQGFSRVCTSIEQIGLIVSTTSYNISTTKIPSGKTKTTDNRLKNKK